jgi:hypothetical protein
MSKIICKPVLKWAGGKTQILDHIINNIPKIISNGQPTILIIIAMANKAAMNFSMI